MPLNVKHFTHLINDQLAKIDLDKQPKALYEPMRYTLALSGKRIRPTLALLSYTLFKDDCEKIIKPALALEIFHNFTLIHDDIMDNASIRRGKVTAHKKWNRNTALLSGDAMLIKAYELLLAADSPNPKELLQAFNKCAIQVCEGQQLDMDYECKAYISTLDYLEMIRLKTAVLLGFSLALGALLAGATDKQRACLYEFGINMGMSFQLKDDLLDVFGNPRKFGKKIGGDIIAHKKTFLLVKTFETADDKTLAILRATMTSTHIAPEEKVRRVTKIYRDLQLEKLAINEINHYLREGFRLLGDLSINREERKGLMIDYANFLIDREH